MRGKMDEKFVKTSDKQGNFLKTWVNFNLFIYTKNWIWRMRLDVGRTRPHHAFALL